MKKFIKIRRQMADNTYPFITNTPGHKSYNSVMTEINYIVYQTC